MITKEELKLLNELGYSLTERRDINKNLQVRVYKNNTPSKTIIAIYNNISNTSVLLYKDTYNKLLDNNVLIDSKRKTGTKRKSF
jgi:hypothetical protein